MNSINKKTSDIREILNTVSEQMLNTRPEKQISYYSYTDCDAIRYERQSFIHIDFSKISSDFTDDCIGVAKTYLKCGSDSDGSLVLALRGYCRAELNGACVAVNLSKELHTYPITLHAGRNELVLKICAAEESFTCEFAVCVSRYIGLWANDYLFHTKTVTGNGSDTGILLYEPFSTGEIAPDKALDAKIPSLKLMTPQHEDSAGDFDFIKLKAQGHCAYAYAIAKGDFTVSHQCPVSVLINQKNVYSGSEGEFSCKIDKESTVLIKCIKGETEWGFHADLRGELRNGLISDYGWMWIDGFGNEEASLLSCFAPEFDIQFTKPYRDYFNNPVFWKFNCPDTHLRVGLESIFFGQWFYALMVGIHGLNICSYRLGNADYVSYFQRHMKMICELYELSNYDYALFGNTELYPRGAVLDNLDAIGTIGMNLCDYYIMTNDSSALPIISALTDAALNNIPRFDDGTFYRLNTMWADDIYMSCPFLIRAARVLHRPEYYDEVIRQIRGFKKKLWIEEEKLFSHIYFPDTKLPNRIPWGRGNGWMALTLTEIIRFLPESYSEKQEIIALFQEFCEGILKTLDEEKNIFHQVLNRPESYEETSCSAIFIIAFIRGYQYGLLDKKYVQAAKKVWNALTELAIDDIGNVHNVCMGSGCSMENEYYFTIPTKINDDHGTGIVLLAGSEILALENDTAALPVSTIAEKG